MQRPQSKRWWWWCERSGVDLLLTCAAAAREPAARIAGWCSPPAPDIAQSGVPVRPAYRLAPSMEGPAAGEARDRRKAHARPVALAACGLLCAALLQACFAFGCGGVPRLLCVRSCERGMRSLYVNAKRVLSGCSCAIHGLCWLLHTAAGVCVLCAGDETDSRPVPVSCLSLP